ncbi:hypothetical protein [Chryseobacterium sp. SIMBA_038]|uniref:hypothetical protein n=1 Tax=Chryseobacterium sp. SIMBA_038 TaxID=3085780 RepID=UPI003978FA2B
MTNVKTKNSLILLIMFSIFSCKENHKIDHHRDNLNFKIEFNDFGKRQINITKDNWDKHKANDFLYFDILLKNANKKKVIIKTKKVANNIPLLINYTKNKNNVISLEIIQQFNTVYSDSIVFKGSNESLKINNAFRIGHQHNGTDEVCPLTIIEKADTLDISNYEMKNCIQRKKS